jgi:uncharacterized peroxidase-related enzyme
MSFLRAIPEASLIDVFRAYPEFARPLHEFAQQLMRGPSPFTEQQRELIAAYVSSLNHCEFCRAAHIEAGRHYGTPDDLVDHLLKGIEHAPIDERFKPVLFYVRMLTLAPGRVTQSDVKALYDAGWDDTAVSHAALVCAFFSFMNRWVDGLGIEADPTVVRRAGEMLHKKGYAAVIELLDHARLRSGPAANTDETKSVSS